MDGLKIIGKIELPEPRQGKHHVEQCARCYTRNRRLIYSTIFNGSVCHDCLMDLDQELWADEYDNDNEF